MTVFAHISLFTKEQNGKYKKSFWSSNAFRHAFMPAIAMLWSAEMKMRLDTALFFWVLKISVFFSS